MSVASWYDMNAEMDDRPDDVKKKLGLKAEIQAEAEAAATTETTQFSDTRTCERGKVG